MYHHTCVARRVENTNENTAVKEIRGLAKHSSYDEYEY